MKLKVINIESEIRVFKPEEKWSLPKTCKLCQFEWQNIFNTMMWWTQKGGGRVPVLFKHLF
jgi:hypothetical protein